MILVLQTLAKAMDKTSCTISRLLRFLLAVFPSLKDNTTPRILTARTQVFLISDLKFWWPLRASVFTCGSLRDRSGQFLNFKLKQSRTQQPYVIKCEGRQVEPSGPHKKNHNPNPTSQKTNPITLTRFQQQWNQKKQLLQQLNFAIGCCIYQPTKIYSPQQVTSIRK